MKIKEIGFVCYNVKNIEVARKFYEGVLGLVPPAEVKHPEVWIEYDLGAGAALALGTWEKGTDGATAALEVEDFDEAISHLKQNNIPFTLEPMDSPVCRMAMIQDPDGNKLMIHKRK